MVMQQDELHTDLLKHELLKAMHDEGLLESFLPIVYKNASYPPLKAFILKLMDANKRHQKILDTAILSVPSSASEGEVEGSMISSLIHSVDIKDEEAKQEALLVTLLQKVVYQQVANYKILYSLTSPYEFHALSEDFRHMVEETTSSFNELQKIWVLALAAASH